MDEASSQGSEDTAQRRRWRAALWRWLIAPVARLAGFEARAKAEFLAALTATATVLGAVTVALRAATDPAYAHEAGWGYAACAVMLLPYGICRAGYVRAAGWLTALLATAGAITTTLTDPHPTVYHGFMAAGVVLAAFVLPLVDTAILAGLTIVVVLLAGLVSPVFGSARSQSITLSFLLLMAVIVLFGMRLRDYLEAHRRRQLADTERIVALGQLAAGVAHEINNPLTYITTSIALLAQNLQKAAEVSSQPVLEELAPMGEAAERIRVIARDLRVLSRPPEGDPEPVDPRSAVQLALRMTHNELTSRGRVEQALQPTPPVRVNAVRLAQVLINLLTNAARSFSRDDPQTNVVTLRSGVDGGMVRIDIADNGPGIAEHVLPHIFEPFFTTRRVGEGTGLGLPVSRNIITGYGGELRVQTSPHGTTMSVLLPAAEPIAAPAAESMPAHREQQGPRNAQRILVVDDEPLVAKAVQRSLREHEITVASDGAEAIARCKAERFDLVICDLRMPTASGMEVYRQVCTARPERRPRFILVSGGAVSAEEKRFVASYDGPTLAKPFRADELRRLVAQVLD